MHRQWDLARVHDAIPQDKGVYYIMKLIIDRFEGNMAIVELPDGKTVDCPKELLPQNAKEGSILSITVDETATNAKLTTNTERMNSLFKD